MRNSASAGRRRGGSALLHTHPYRTCTLTWIALLFWSKLNFSLVTVTTSTLKFLLSETRYRTIFTYCKAVSPSFTSPAESSKRQVVGTLLFIFRRARHKISSTTNINYYTLYNHQAFDTFRAERDWPTALASLTTALQPLGCHLEELQGNKGRRRLVQTYGKA